VLSHFLNFINSLDSNRGPIKLTTQQIYLQQYYKLKIFNYKVYKLKIFNYKVYKLKIKLSREERIQLTMINDNNFHYVIYIFISKKILIIIKGHIYILYSYFKITYSLYT